MSELCRLQLVSECSQITTKNINKHDKLNLYRMLQFNYTVTRSVEIAPPSTNAPPMLTLYIEFRALATGSVYIAPPMLTLYIEFRALATGSVYIAPPMLTLYIEFRVLATGSICEQPLPLVKDDVIMRVIKQYLMNKNIHFEG